MTETQKLFCVYYIQSYNATQSYLRAYHCKRSTANVEGSRLLKLDKINKFISKWQIVKFKLNICMITCQKFYLTHYLDNLVSSF
ncbi:terminase small subunit [Fructilactobacillus sanfranciscensis]|uniref:Uncharacterized protein n=2 Tax=Fructilactobacillus sanfranciscensis TaxID=1625 RepID=A0A5C4TK14_FRUSA|nr:hypothetical protein DID87_00955 [Fructilactobacillus sanfranciscensis]